MLFPLPFGPMIPKNSPVLDREGDVVEGALRLVRHPVERVQEVLLERRPLLVRAGGRSCVDALDLDRGPAHTRSANQGASPPEQAEPDGEDPERDRDRQEPAGDGAERVCAR